MSDVGKIKRMPQDCTADERREVLEYLRVEFPIHPIEARFNVKAEVILEAIARASDLTLRGVRGVIAEAAFDSYVAGALQGWESLPVAGDPPYGFLLKDAIGQVRVQVKMQRLKNRAPMMASQAYRRLSPDMYVVETQRTGGGIQTATGESTRPYRFGEFDILAVSFHPSTNDWRLFTYAVADWLLPRLDDDRLMLKFQPIAQAPNEDWSIEFETCIQWLRSNRQKRIRER